MNEDVLQKIKRALAEKGGVDIGHFQWINLDMVKDEVGERWISIRKKIYSAAANHLEKRLGPGDVLLRCRGGFILVYADLTGDAAVAQTASLAESVNRFFLGDRILRNLDILAKTTRLDATELSDFLKRSDLQDSTEPSRESAVDTAEPAQTEGEKSGWQAFRSGTSSPNEVIARDRRLEERPAAAASKEGSIAQSSHVTVGAIIDATGEIKTFDSLAFEVPEPIWDDIIFKPCWDVKFNHLTASFCLPRRIHKGDTLYGLQTLLGNRDRAILHSMDHAVAVTAQRGFLKQSAAGRKCAVVIPVQYETVIGTQDRIRYFSILQKVPQRARKYFYLRIDNIPDGAPIGQMEELFRSMRIFGSNLLAKIPPGTIQLDRFDNCSIAIYSTSLEREWARAGLPDHIARKLAEQAVSISRKSKRGALTQVDTLGELNFGLDAGYEIFTGAVIGTDRPLPCPLLPVTLDDITRAARSAA
ncbi:hypothetical protein [uncultured Maricaulis sp.]|uniref:hypothetical protein n=1 Tax=uncultured Maricaulis sp. TaxID=174710 RepID=UPI00261B90D0|nr:hypothetical protein [uncultured Maricaulis sp.]